MTKGRKDINPPTVEDLLDAAVCKNEINDIYNPFIFELSNFPKNGTFAKHDISNQKLLIYKN